MSGTEEQVVLTPILEGWLTLAEIATLAGVGVTTVRGYHARQIAGFPKAAWKSGPNPLWAIDDVINWLGTRQFAKTQVTLRPDGSLLVTKPSDYRERKATGKVGPRDA